MGKGGDVLETHSKSLYNASQAPGWTKDETMVLRLALQHFGVGKWSEILRAGILPGKTITQLNLQTQRVLGQQSLGAFMNMRIDVEKVRQDNEKRVKLPGVTVKSGLIINSGENPTAESKKRKHEELKKLYGTNLPEVDQLLLFKVKRDRRLNLAKSLAKFLDATNTPSASSSTTTTTTETAATAQSENNNNNNHNDAVTTKKDATAAAKTPATQKRSLEEIQLELEQLERQRVALMNEYFSMVNPATDFAQSPLKVEEGSAPKTRSRTAGGARRKSNKTTTTTTSTAKGKKVVGAAVAEAAAAAAAAVEEDGDDEQIDYIAEAKNAESDDDENDALEAAAAAEEEEEEEDLDEAIARSLAENDDIDFGEQQDASASADSDYEPASGSKKKKKKRKNTGGKKQNNPRKGKKARK